MPITVAFTISGFVALIVHLVYLRRVILNRNAQEVAAHIDPVHQNGPRLKIANAFVQMEVTRSVLNSCFLIAGGGLLLGHRPLGYFLALPPFLSIVSSFFALRGIR